MDMVSKFGLMGLGTKVTGSIIKLVVKASSGMLMEMSLMASGKMTKLMVLAYTCI